MRARLLIVADAQGKADGFDRTLRPPDFLVRFESEPAQAAALAREWLPEAVLLHWGLKAGASDALGRLRAQRGVPILLAGSASQEEALLRGLSEGAFSYLVLPCASSELQARVRAVVRHVRAAAGTDGELRIGCLRVDRPGRRVEVEQRRVALTPKEYELFEFLLESAGRVLTRQQIMDRVWGYQSESGPRNVDYQIFQLRKKLGSRVSSAIDTVSKLGYCFRPESVR